MDRIRKKKICERLRILIQIVFFIIFPSAFASAFAAVKDVFTAFSSGAELEWTPFAKIAVFLLAFTVFAGRFFCGYACAFGALGDWIYKLSAYVQKKIGKKIPEIPQASIRYLQCIKYVVLAVVIAACYAGYASQVNKISPWSFFSVVTAGRFPGADGAAAGILLALILVGMAVRERFFCQFLCPMGALFSLMPVLPTGQLTRDQEKCIPGCRMCSRICPVSLKLGEDEIRNGECIRCNKCLTSCPRGSIATGHLTLDTSSPAAVVIQAAVLLAVLEIL